MSKVHFKNFICLISLFSLFLNLFSPFILSQAFAEETTPVPTPLKQEISISPSPAVTEIPPPSPSISPSPSSTVGIDEILTPPSPTINPEQTSSLEESISEDPVLVSDPTPSMTQAIEAASAPEATPLPSVEPQVTPEITPEITPQINPTPKPAWVSNGDKSYETSENVALNNEYVYPENDKVRVRFNKLPESLGKLVIKEIKLTSEQMRQTGAITDIVYDITSNMENGTFEYDLTLPLPENIDKESLRVKAIESMNELEDAQTVNESTEKSENTVIIKGLNHFTVFVLISNPADTENGMLTVSKDAFIQQDSGGNGNNGASSILNIFSQSVSKNRRILVEFDLSSIPKGAIISGATLELKMTNAPGTSRQYNVYRINDSWEEHTVTWNNQPEKEVLSTAQTESGTTDNEVLSWNVLDDVNAFLSGIPNYGWMIQDNTEDSINTYLNQSSFASKENGAVSNNPRLTITFASINNTTNFNSPSSQTAVDINSGKNNGYEGASGNALSPGDNNFAVDMNSGISNNGDCYSNGADKHIFYDYNLNVPFGSTINGIEVRQDLKIDSLLDSPFSCIQLSWDGGNSWTPGKQINLSSKELTPYYFGNSSDVWERNWNYSDFSNSNFRVRVVNGDNNIYAANRDFSLDWVPVRVYYVVDEASPSASSVVVSPTTINRSLIGAENLHITIDFSEVMDTSIAPNIVFDPPLTDVLTNRQGSWIDGDTYKLTADIVDSGAVDIENVSLSISSAKDVVGNVMNIYNSLNALLIDLVDPQVNSSCLSVTGAGGNSGIFKKGDIPIAQWDNSSCNSNSDIVSVAFDISDFSSLATSVTASVVNNVWTASLPAALDSKNSPNNNIIVTVTDDGGNSNTVKSTNNYVIDSIIPSLTSVSISSNNVNNSDLAKVGDNVNINFTSNETIQPPTIDIEGHQITAVNISGNNWQASYTLQTEDIEGEVDFSIDFIDLAGNEGVKITATSNSSSVVFDKTNPSTPGAPSTQNPTNSTTQSWGWLASTDNLGIGGYVWRVLGWWEGSVINNSVNSLLPEGNWNFYVKALDTAGNQSSESSALVVVDMSAPSIASLLINSGNQYTNSRNVALSISAMDNLSGVKEMKIGNGGPYRDWEDYNTTRFWTLSDGDGTKNVYIKFKDEAGNYNSSYLVKSSIILDTIAPVVSAGPDKLANGIFTQNATAGDDISGISDYAWSKISGPGNIIFENSNEEDATITADTDGVYLLRLTVTDGAGNSSSSDMTLIWDQTSPTVTSVSSSITDGTYKEGEEINISVELSEIVNVSTVSGLPRLKINL
ncbi:DNRLRE domain-containing protein, partial [Candidatus Parcubacteria bacterium]